MPLLVLLEEGIGQNAVRRINDMINYDEVYDEIETRFKKAYARDGVSGAIFIKPGHSDEEIVNLEETIGMTIAEDYRKFIIT